MSISIHPPRVGWDFSKIFGPLTFPFQSTHPVWGGTCACADFDGCISISIHPPRVGWDCSMRLMPGRSSISIHPPRVGWDHYLNATDYASADFNPPTPCGVGLSRQFCCRSRSYFNPPTPCGVGPGISNRTYLICIISIHPPRVGWDSPFPYHFQSTRYFNPPTPCGVGQACSATRRYRPQFQSTHPVWGGTPRLPAPAPFGLISIHPPRVGWDTLENRWNFSLFKFQSTHPVWGGTGKISISAQRV